MTSEKGKPLFVIDGYKFRHHKDLQNNISRWACCIKSSTFPPTVWAEFAATTLRTTNGCESFHSKLNGLFYTAHPNIYHFIEILKGIQSETHLKLRTHRALTFKQARRQKEDFIRKNMIDLQQGHTTRLCFIRNLSFRFQPVQL